MNDHIIYILQLIDRYSKTDDKNAYILIRGYIIKHIETCEESDCPLKWHIKEQKRLKNKKNKNKEDPLGKQAVSS